MIQYKQLFGIRTYDAVLMIVMDSNNESPSIVYEGEEFQHSTSFLKSETPKIIQWVIKYSGGYVKDEKQANYVLLVFVVVAIVVSLFLFFGSGKNKSQWNNPDPAKIIQHMPN